MRWWSLVPALALVVSPVVALVLDAEPDATRADPVFTLDAVAVACPGYGDGVCLAYDGVTPGPVLDVRLGDEVTIVLRNRIAETLPDVPGPDDVKARLADAAVSFHVHGTAIAADKDGVAAHPGTDLVDSSAAPGGSFTYRFRAAYPGTWNYHDHVLGGDGKEGVARGLFGLLMVRNGAERTPDHVLDLHVHNTLDLETTVNAGRGLSANVTAGAPFELGVVGLGEFFWDVRLEAPDGTPLGALDVGPGISERFRVTDAEPGTYRWTARYGPFTHEGEVTAT